jgi:hypothetical protein
MTDPLPEIKARWPRPAGLDTAIAPRAIVDLYRLVDEVERLRRLVDKPLFAIWQQVEAETRDKWFGEHDLREENRRLRGELAEAQAELERLRSTSPDPPEVIDQPGT